jgi:hypothetical protein
VKRVKTKKWQIGVQTLFKGACSMGTKLMWVFERQVRHCFFVFAKDFFFLLAVCQQNAEQREIADLFLFTILVLFCQVRSCQFTLVFQSSALSIASALLFCGVNQSNGCDSAIVTCSKALVACCAVHSEKR